MYNYINFLKKNWKKRDTYKYISNIYMYNYIKFLKNWKKGQATSSFNISDFLPLKEVIKHLQQLKNQ